MKTSYGKWKSQIEKELYNLCQMKLKDFPDYSYLRSYELGYEPMEVVLRILESHSFRMKFEKN